MFLRIRPPGKPIYPGSQRLGVGGNLLTLLLSYKRERT